MSERMKGWITLVGNVSAAQPIVLAANAGACAIVTDVAISGLSAGALTVALAEPDYPRNLIAILTDANASITGATVTVYGLDQNGEAISEVFTFTAAGTQTGNKAFSKVSAAVWALTSGTVTASSDKIAIGVGNKLGLPAGPGAVYEEVLSRTFDGDADLGTFNKTYGTYLPAGTMDGSKPVEVYYRYRVPIHVY